jgi:hypothetical protein
MDCVEEGADAVLEGYSEGVSPFSPPPFTLTANSVPPQNQVPLSRWHQGVVHRPNILKAER